MTQKTFADLNWELKQKKTRRERFLEEMTGAIPWKELEDIEVKLLTPKKKPVGGELTEEERLSNRRLSARRAIGEYPFHVIKNIFRSGALRHLAASFKYCRHHL